MPKIPTYEASETIRTGSTGPSANAPSFGVQLGGLAHGMHSLGHDLSGIAQQKRTDDEYKWMVDAAHQYQLEAADFENKPENNTREDFGALTLDYLQKRKSEYLSQAPTARAATRLKAQLDNIVESRAQRARDTGEVTKRKNAFTGLDNGIRGLMTAYRQDATNDPVYAAGNLEPQIDLLKESIEARWGKTVPEVAEKMLGKLERDFVIGVSEYDSTYARKLLDESEHLDESDRKTLLNVIESQEKSNNRLVQDEFADWVEKQLDFGRQTREPVKDVPLKDFQAAMGKEAGALAKQKFDRKQKEINKVSASIASVRGNNVTALSDELGKILSDPDISQLEKSSASTTIEALMREAKTDPHGYLAQHNREVGRAYEFAAALPAGQRSAGMERANRIALEYQGYAPEGTLASEQGKYLNLPTNARHLMSRGQAVSNLSRILAGSPEQQVSSVNEMMALYPKSQQAIAFNDLVTLPPRGSGLSGGVRWAFLHQHKPFVKEFIAAQNAEAVKKISTNNEKVSEFNDALDNNKDWKAFAQPYMAWQRLDELADYKDGLMNYAIYLREFKGAKSPEAAIRQASEQLIHSAFLHHEVNGISMLVQRERKDGTMRSDEDGREIKRMLDLALFNVPVDQVKIKAPDGRSLFPMFDKSIGDKPLVELLPKIIQDKGFFVPTPDGQGATLYLRTDDGVTGQLLDKNNQPWEVDFDALPAMERIPGRPTSKFSWTQDREVLRGRFWKNYPRDDYKVGPGMQPVP